MTCDDRGQDRYRRVIAICRTDSGEINAQIVRRRWAVDWPKYPVVHTLKNKKLGASRRTRYLVRPVSDAVGLAEGTSLMSIKKILGWVASILAFVIAYAVVRELKTDWFASKSWQQASQTAAEDIEKKIQTAQHEATAGKSATDILIEKSNKDVTAELNKSTTDKQKHVTASNFFYGAYFLKTRTRAEYCGALGIAIPTFVAAYKQKHRDLFATAERYQIEDFHDHGKTYDIEKFYKIMQPAMEKYIVQDMKDIASSLGVSEKEACSLLEQNAAAVVDEMDYRKRAPEIAQTLLQK